ncbi:trichome birefringence-like protein 19 [Tanacetum coccineum]
MCFKKPHAFERWAEALHRHANGLVQRRQALDALLRRIIVSVVNAKKFVRELKNLEGPYYTNETCWAIQEHQNCMKFGRTDRDFLKWRWKAYKCELPIFDPMLFLKMMTGKSLAFVVDSVARNLMQSLLCLLSRSHQLAMKGERLRELIAIGKLLRTMALVDDVSSYAKVVTQKSDYMGMVGNDASQRVRVGLLDLGLIANDRGEVSLMEDEECEESVRRLRKENPKSPDDLCVFYVSSNGQGVAVADGRLRFRSGVEQVDGFDGLRVKGVCSCVHASDRWILDVWLVRGELSVRNGISFLARLKNIPEEDDRIFVIFLCPRICRERHGEIRQVTIVFVEIMLVA